MIVLFFVFFLGVVFWLPLWHLQTTFLWKLILLKHVYVAPRLKSSLLKFYSHDHWYEISISQKANESFLFYVDFSFPLSRTFCFTGFEYEYLGGCHIGNRNCLPFGCIWVHRRFYMAYVLLICLVFCVLCFCRLFLSMLCVLYPYLPVPLNGPILISPWLFLLIYIFEIKINNMKCFEPGWTILFVFWLFELAYLGSAKYKK
jgi:hypothetical protein